ncbi:MAG: hypothetical protein AAF633_18015, partial [Chloroflexota bacterium]
MHQMTRTIKNQLANPLTLALMIIALILSNIPMDVGAQTDTTVNVNPALTSISMGDSTTVNIVVDLASGENYGAGSYQVSYDHTILNETDISINS